MTRIGRSSAGGKTALNVYRQVAALHVAGIDQGFLTSLGAPFLEILYWAIDSSPESVLLIACDPEGKVVGFVSGGHGMGRIYRRMLRRLPLLLKTLMPALMSPKKVVRIAELLWFGRKQHSVLVKPTVELYSITVTASARGTGVAQSLYEALIAHFCEQGVAELRIVVGETLTVAHHFYRKMGALPMAQICVHRGSTSVVYRHELSTTQP